MPVVASQSLKELNSFHVEATARYFCQAGTISDISEALTFSQRLGLPVLVLGGGSNVLFTQDYPGLVLHIDLQGIEVSEAADGDVCRVVAAAGENWHGFVEDSLQRKLGGLENLALIPGTVGAAPIQNIGAYGVEVASFIHSVTVFDRAEREVRQIAAADCGFAYRDSLFKQEEGLDLIVLAVSFDLPTEDNSEARLNTDYGALQSYLDEQGISSPDRRQLFDAVCAIRRSKLPDPNELGNAGSFFKNPVVSISKRDQLLETYPELPSFPSGEEGLVKLPAAYLLDQLGWRGKTRGRAAVSERHALVLTNPGEASGEEIMLLAQEMASSVLTHFGIALQSEVRIL